MMSYYIAVLFLKSVLVALQNASKSISSDAIFKSIQSIYISMIVQFEIKKLIKYTVL